MLSKWKQKMKGKVIGLLSCLALLIIACATHINYGTSIYFAVPFALGTGTFGSLLSNTEPA